MATTSPWPVKLGVSPIAWSNDDLPELGGETPLETCLAEAKAAGYAGIELGSKFPRDPVILAPLVDHHGLAIVSGWYGARLLERSAEAEIAALDAHAALLRAMRAPVVVFAEVSGTVHDQPQTPVSERPVIPEDDWASFVERLNTVARHLAGLGLTMAYHHHMGTVIETEAEIDRLMAETDDAVGLLVDTGHLAFAGTDPGAVIERHGARIRHVHCKDVRPAILQRARAENASFLDAVRAGAFTVPGDGALDFTDLLHKLRRSGYEGWLVVEAEQDPAKAEPLAYARKGYAALQQAVASAGSG